MNIGTKLDENDDAGNLFRDVLFGCLGLILVVLGVVLFFINEGKKNEDTNYIDHPLGNIRVDLYWPNELDVDIDLWVKAPDDMAVGYSNPGGNVMNLLRDDLGRYKDSTQSTVDSTGVNMETAISRGLPPGEYVVNVHWFSNRANLKQVPITVVLVINTQAFQIPKYAFAPEIREVKDILVTPGYELTVFRFRLDENGKIVPGSENRVQKKIREGN